MNTKPKAIISLFDHTGLAVKPWVESGYKGFIFDLQHTTSHDWTWQSNWVRVGSTADTWHDAISDVFANYNVVMVFGFPPCTDLAVSGAKHFAAKALANPNYRDDAMRLVYLTHDVAQAHGVPFMIENPISVISSEWRKPDYMFNPCDYGGYLPLDDESLYPSVIPSRDAYTKKTCLWTGNGFVMPEPKPVEPERFTDRNGLNYAGPHWKLGGKSLRTKNIRSATPRGFAAAVFAANA